MKITTKDVITGGLVVLFSVVALWLNMDHTLGSARRMGPGYMPMLVLWMLLGLGLIIVAIGLTSGPEQLERWSRLEVLAMVGGVVTTLVVTAVLQMAGVGQGTWSQFGIGLLAGLLVMSIAPYWRPLGLIHAAMALFGLLLEPLGLIIALGLAMVLSALADREHTPLGVLGMVVFLCVLCWGVFIWQLDIRVPVWPTIF